MMAVTLALNYRKTGSIALKVLVGALESDARTLATRSRASM
jgi:hypothetical protein